ncbi:GSU2403 family nucleotidyltransferase fold protein [Pseudosulfitobacter sp. SM2401]|uniref:nucleotidyltransferase family protein n=1 Tax=Pseudosulfitobacter sp. SM2401 TaxID=3350098 RepID=UPI0036F3ADFB
MIDRHSTTAHAAYHDLMRSLLDEQISNIRGTPTRVVRGGKSYWYDSFRIGSDVRKTYIGEESPKLLERLDHLKELRQETDERRKHRSRLVRILRAEGFQNVDAATGSLMSALGRAGVFRLGGTVVGTHAFRLYEGTLGVRYRFDDMAQTGDIDIASFEQLSLALEDIVNPPLPEVLDGFSFAPVPSLDGNKVWRWRQTRNDLMVEFLTPSFTEDEGVRPLAALGVDAQSLHHLNYLIADPIKAVVTYRSGVLVQIPRPERFAIHKLIVADRRRKTANALKSEKDRLQAKFLVKILTEDRPDDLLEAYTDARNAGPKWRARLDATLERLPSVKTMLSSL